MEAREPLKTACAPPQLGVYANPWAGQGELGPSSWDVGSGSAQGYVEQ